MTSLVIFYEIDTWGQYYKTFTDLINSSLLYAILFVTVSPFHTSLIFASKDGTYPSGPLILDTGKWLKVTSTLAYYGMESMSLHHSPDASTFSGFKPTCFVDIVCFS